VKLQVTDDNGATNIATVVVNAANRPPVAGFTHSPALPKTLEQVTFTSNSSDPDGSISSYAWDTDNNGQFDNGTSSSASKTFATAGTYTVKLKVTDNNGDSTIATDTVTIANRPPTAAFGFRPPRRRRATRPSR
jgi:PKD repeat protein